MLRRALTVVALVGGLGAGAASVARTQPAPAAAASAPAPAAAPAPKIDYTDPATWLCRPGREDACTVNLDATVIQADGTTTIDRFHADPNAPIDCFYVYPTVSRDPGVNATMAIEAEEENVVLQQFARFGGKCRLYAPMYRQFTITALTAMMTGHPMTTGGGWEVGFNDVVDAWNEYLAHDNHGRGVVLIGHSQGAGMLTGLIGKEIAGKPVQSRMISAILMGTSLQVPPGKDVGGDFKVVPLCHSSTQLGCVITFADFRAESPPPPNARFGQGRPADGTVAACVNPAAIGGGSGPMKAFMPARALAMGGAPIPWTDPPTQIDTPFVELPGLLTAACVSNEHGSYLAVTLHPTPGGKRANDIVGDLIVGGMVQKDWGLHLVDANLNLGNLVDIVGDESRAYLAQARK